MNKYLSIKTTSEGVVLVPIGTGAMASLISSTQIYITTGDISIDLVCVGANQTLIDNINDAITTAAETTWTNATSIVEIPKGVEIVSVVTAGGGVAPLEVFQGLVAQGIDNTTTSVMKYGVNVFTTSTGADYATKLPQPITGKSTIIINNSSAIIMVYPSNIGGQINNLTIDTPLLIPADGEVYEFICTLNPLPGNWSVSGPPINPVPLVFLDFEINHTQGVASSIAGNPGTIGEVPSMITSGSVATVTTTGGCTLGIPTCNVLINGTASTLRAEPLFTTLNNVKVETNIMDSDTSGGSQDSITFNINRSFIWDYFNIQNSLQMISVGGSKFAAGYSDSVPIGGVSGGTNIGDVGTQYRDSLPFLGTGNYPFLRSIGAPPPSYTSGDITSNAYYYFLAYVGAQAATKVYKFRVTFTLD